MKSNYNKRMKLRGATCGSEDFFLKDENTGEITCTKCNRVYHGGYDELVSENQHVIGEVIEDVKNEVSQDLQKDIKVMLKKTGFKLK